MADRVAAVLGLLGAFAFSDAHAEERKQVVTATLNVCAMAVADEQRGKAGGGATGSMTVTCTVANRGRAWDCVTAYPGENEKSQHWVLTSKSVCDLASKATACTLSSETGSLRVLVAATDGIGIMQLRLDLDVGASIAAKVCAGTLALGGTAPGWFCGPALCTRKPDDCNASQAAFAKRFPDDKDYRDPCVHRGVAVCIQDEPMCFMNRELCEQISRAKDHKPCIDIR